MPTKGLRYFNKLVQKLFSILRLQRKVYNANCALEYFILNNWTFLNEQFLSLDNAIKEEDTRAFHYTDFVQFDMKLYLKNCIRGAKIYLLGEKEENIPWARKNLAKMKRIDFCVRASVYTILFYIFFIKFDLIGYSWGTIKNIVEYLNFW